MKSTRVMNWMTFVAFFLVQLLPNILFKPFIHHRITHLLPDIFTFHLTGGRHPATGPSFFFHHPSFFSYDFPVMALALVWPFISSPQLLRRSRFLFQPLFAVVGIVAGYLIEVLTFHLRVLHGRWPDDWRDGFILHGYSCFWTVVSVILAFGLGLCLALVTQNNRMIHANKTHTCSLE